MNTPQLLPLTIEMRAMAQLEKGVEPIEAIKLAFEEEENFLWLLMDVDMQRGTPTKVGEEVKSALCEIVYNKLIKPNL